MVHCKFVCGGPFCVAHVLGAPHIHYCQISKKFDKIPVAHYKNFPWHTIFCGAYLAVRHKNISVAHVVTCATEYSAPRKVFFMRHRNIGELGDSIVSNVSVAHVAGAPQKRCATKVFGVCHKINCCIPIIYRYITNNK